MQQLQLSKPAEFGEAFLSAYLTQGFQSLTKRDIDLLVFLLLERDGALARAASNFAIARQLRVTPARVKGLRREAYARWRHLLGPDDRPAQLRAVLQVVLTEQAIRAGARHASEKNKKEGFLAVRVEHADDREELEQGILDAGGIPIYERNRDVLVVRFDTLLTLAVEHGFVDRDPKKVRAALQKLAPTAEDVKALLRKDIKEVTWEDVRATFNAVGAAAVTGIIDAKVIALLKIALPFLA